ncbi:MAG: hypothetical protein IJ538_01755 [Clostridia bacterium]|nr:hypothetical protein [Clostridia bacterium]
MKLKKYPLLISLIISCVLVVASLFILGFFGINSTTEISGGSQIEISVSNSVDQKQAVVEARKVLGKYGAKVETAFYQDKYVANGDEILTKSLVVKTTARGFSDDIKANIRNDLASALGVDVSLVSEVYEITSSVTSTQILYIALGVGIVTFCLFVFAWIRYNFFAGLSILLANLHNIILYLAIIILTRIPLSLISIAGLAILTIIMAALVIAVYENYRDKANLHIDDKLTVSERMMQAQKMASKPFILVLCAVVVFALMMFFIPVISVRLSALGILIGTLVALYTSTIVGPGAYAALLEVQDANQRAVMSRNDEINKEIQKKIKKNAPKHTKKNKK